MNSAFQPFPYIYRLYCGTAFISFSGSPFGTSHGCPWEFLNVKKSEDCCSVMLPWVWQQHLALSLSRVYNSISFWVVTVQHSLVQQGEHRSFALPSILSGFKKPHYQPANKHTNTQTQPFRIKKKYPHAGLAHGHNTGCIKYGQVFWQLGDQHSGSAPLCFCQSCMVGIQSALLLFVFALLCSRVSEHSIVSPPSFFTPAFAVSHIAETSFPEFWK